MPISIPNVRRLTALLSGVSALSFGASIAHADTVPAASSPTEVVVTASRHKEKARDVPVADTVISGEKLNVLNSSGQDIRFLSSRAPSLLVESSFGRTFPRFYIRGLGNTDFDVNAAQPVSVYYDEVALENPMLKAFPVFDLASVEVLRGPQGSLFGRNTPAGVIKLDSAKPSDTFGGYGSVSWGTYNTVNAEAAVTGPIQGGFSFRLSALEQRRDNWVTNTSTTNTLAKDKLEGYDDKAIRFQLAYKHDNFDALLNVHGRSLSGTPRIFRAGLFKQGTNDFSDGFDISKVALDGVTSQSLSSSGVSLHLNYHFSLGTLHSVTAYEHAKVESSGDIDGGDVYVYPPLGLNNALFYDSTGGTSKPEEFSQEVRFEMQPADGLTTQVGAYYFLQKLYYSELDYTTTGAIDADVIHNNYGTNFGLFASAEYKATSALTLRGGLRYASDRKKDRISGQGIATGVTLPVLNRVQGDNVSGDLSATYVLTSQVNLYARVATGYLGPAIQDRVNFGSVPTTAKAQTTLSGEAGVKSDYFGHKLYLDFDVYDYETKDIQLTAVGGGNNSARLYNAKKAIGYGAEFDMTAKPIENLFLTAGASYNHTEIKDPTLGVAPCGSGMCTVLNPVVNGLAQISGNPLPQAPKYVANFTARYAIPTGDGGQWFAYTDWSYRSKVNFFLYEAAEFTGKPETIGGLRLGYLTAKNLELAVFVRNITNQIRAESAIDFNNLTGMVNDPRTYGVSIRKAF